MSFKTITSRKTLFALGVCAQVWPLTSVGTLVNLMVIRIEELIDIHNATSQFGSFKISITFK